MFIFVRNLLTDDYKMLTLEVEPSDTILSVMDKVEDRLGVPPILQRFVFNGNSLDHHTGGTLADHKVEECSTLHALNTSSGWHELTRKTLKAMGIAIDGDGDGVDPTPHDMAVGYIEEKESTPPPLVLQQQGGAGEEKKMRVYVKDYVVPGLPRKFMLFVEAGDTVASVMEQVQRRRGYPLVLQELHYAGQRLLHDSSGTLQDYGVRQDSELMLDMYYKFAVAADRAERKRKKAEETASHDDNKTTAQDDNKTANHDDKRHKTSAHDGDKTTVQE